MTRLGKHIQPDRPAKSHQQRPRPAAGAKKHSAAISAKPKATPQPPAVKKTERLACPQEVYDRAVDLFNGNIDAAWSWIYWPARALGGKTPIEMAQTEEGIQVVLHHIGRIEHGILA